MDNKLSLYILTDTHYLSPAVWEEGECINNREKGDQIAIKSTPFILRSFFAKILEDKDTQYVLITGDLINNGDRQSHEDFIKELRVLTDAGKKVFVTCATHDYAGLGDDENIFHPVRYKKDSCEEIERVYKTQLPGLYYDFGHLHADSIHKESGSYTVVFPEGFKLIAVYDNGNGRSHCGLFDDGFLWLENEIKKSGEKGEDVFIAVHHPVLPPWQVYCDAAEFEMFGGYARLRQLMCEYGVRVVFTGHTHVHGIKKYTDSEGRGFYDITTSALPGAKGRMRKVVFDKEKRTCSVSSIAIDKIEGFDTGGLSAEEYIYSLNFAGLLEKNLPVAKKDWNAFVDDVSHVFNINAVRNHPHLGKAAVSLFCSLKMNAAYIIGGNGGSFTREEKKYLKSLYVKDVVFNILKHVFSGNGPYPPDTVEYRAIEGFIVRGVKIARVFGVDIDKLIPGNRTALETARDFLYNTRTGDDSSIIIDLEDKYD